MNSGGRNRTRTCDPIDVNDVLYQLSHATMINSLSDRSHLLLPLATKVIITWDGWAVNTSLHSFSPCAPHIYKKNPSHLTGVYGAGDGNRTHVTSLEGWGSAIELHPPEDGPDIRSAGKWSGRRDSNSRHPPWQGGTLPLSYYRTLHPLLRPKDWCGRRDLNPYAAKAPDPKSGASAIPPRPHKTCRRSG